ncbi:MULTISPECIES: hypothetical protein [unclassified Bradyrhizobium]
MDDTLAAARRWYAGDLRYEVPVLRKPHLVEAFASVPGEHSSAPDRGASSRTVQRRIPDPDTYPRWLYHDVLVTIDVSRNLNNGMPSFWARNFGASRHRARRSRTPGRAGTGYYSAVLAEIVGSLVA